MSIVIIISISRTVLITVAGTAIQPSFSVILCRFVYLSMFVSRCLLLHRPGNWLPPGVACLQIAYDQTAGVRNIFTSTLCRCH